MLQINGKNVAEMMINGKKVKEAQLNGKMVYSSFPHIPASIDFNTTVGDNTLHLRPQTGGFDCTVYWGDGQSTAVPPDGGNIIHNYAAAGVYNIQIKGKSFAGFRVDNQTGKEKYVAAYSMGRWAVDTMNSCERCFNYCTKLSFISADLFKYNPEITTFHYCFEACSFSSIPEDLFRYNTKATDFGFCFGRCVEVPNIPENLFRYNLLAKSFWYCFFMCDRLTTVPAGLFKNNVEATNFGSSIHWNKNLKTIPEDLFRYNTKATDFSSCLAICESLESVPPNLFRFNVNAKNFDSCFSICTKLTTIPTGLFQYNTAVADFSYCFSRCTKLTLRNDIFGTDYASRFNGKKVDFSGCFNRDSFSGTRGTAPEIWRFTGLTATKTTCFGGAGNSPTSLSNYASIPADWK